MEVYINENLPAKFLVGLALDQKAPDHSTLTVFRECLIQRGKLKIFEQMLDEILLMVLQKGERLGKMQIIDSVHSIAKVNTSKDKNRQDKGKGPHDPNARWGAKHKRKVETEDGKEEVQT